MPKPKAVASLSSLIDSGMEEETQNSDLDAHPSPDSNQENNDFTKKGPGVRGRPKAASGRTTRSKPASRRLSGHTGVAKKKPVPRKKAVVKRTALKEQTNDQQHNNTEEAGSKNDEIQNQSDGEAMAVSMDELDAKEVIEEIPVKRRTRAKKQPELEPEIDPPQHAAAIENDEVFEYTPTVVRQSKLSKKAPAAQQAVAGKLNSSRGPQYDQKIIPDTQEAQVDLEVTDFLGENEYAEEALPQSVFRQSSNKRSNSRQPQSFPSLRRAGSTSDNDKGVVDPVTRRKLGEMTRKFEDLDMKFRNLREIGIKEAEANFDKLKIQSETKSKAANDLIVSLKKEIATQKAVAQESRSLQNQLATSDSALSKAQSQLTQLTASLAEAQNENKALQVKLANSRSASVTVESVNARTPGSAMKGKGSTRTIMVGSAEAAQAAQVALLKEDLYSDLTGLILRGVERGDEADVYDCIQTGRNGTLHFKLAVANDTDAKVHYEDTTFTYTPRLDSNRDRDLLELLPDYLSEEIAFSRMNAAKFYGRVVETLTRKRVDDGMGMEG